MDTHTHNITWIVLIAACGGFVLNMMNLWEDTRKPKNQRIPKDSMYWLFFAFWPVAAGGLALLYTLDGSSLKTLMAFSLGLTAPTTIQAMIAKGSSTPGPPRGAEE